jgi:hypothetical protein
MLAITVAAILIGAVTLTLNICFDSYISGEREVRANKYLDEISAKVIYGSDEAEGIQGAMEILSCGRYFITYVPLWKDESHKPPYIEDEEFLLDAPYKHGSGQPIGEISKVFAGKAEYYEPYSSMFKEEDDKDLIRFVAPIPKGSKMRIVYWPDAEKNKSLASTIAWDPGNKKLNKTHRGATKEISVQGFRNISLSDFEFRYFDNTGREISVEKDGSLKSALTHSITAIELRISVKVEGIDNDTSVFVNLRNTRSGGAPIMIKEGSEIRVPNYKDVSIFSIANITGVSEGNRIELLAVPDDKALNEWKITLEIGVLNGDTVVKSYSIEYPPGKEVFSAKIMKSAQLSLDLLAVGQDKYDYGFDGDEKDIVKMDCDATLKVTRMDPQGAAIYVRP